MALGAKAIGKGYFLPKRCIVVSTLDTSTMTRGRISSLESLVDDITHNVFKTKRTGRKHYDSVLDISDRLIHMRSSRKHSVATFPLRWTQARQW